MSVEFVIQFLARGITFFTYGWLVFDFFVVRLGWLMPNLLVIRTFRVVRTLRLASWVKDLKELVVALLLVIPKMFAIFFLLAILFLIFSILFTDLFKHTYVDGITREDYFSRIDITFFTLFQIMTLNGWAEICKEIMEEYPWAWAPFVCFVIVSSFFFLNLVIAVVCDAVTSVHKETVVEYMKDEISAATSVREALHVEDRLDELASTLKLLIHAQISVMEGFQSLKQSPGSPSSTHREENMYEVASNLKAELKSSFSGKPTRSEFTPVTGNRSTPYLSVGDDEVSDISGSQLSLNVGSVSYPTSTDFWRDVGLSDDQIARVIDRLLAHNNEQQRRHSRTRAVVSDLIAGPEAIDATTPPTLDVGIVSPPSPPRGPFA